ncbi:hypothetical protein SDC9_56274 [bioreactor metagenome]|uniref:Uncharacterized protein n=1 Tax=bioreactor metagenome TaxID=1076179 RepID=A0A644X1D7_9ZZZZ
MTGMGNQLILGENAASKQRDENKTLHDLSHFCRKLHQLQCIRTGLQGCHDKGHHDGYKGVQAAHPSNDDTGESIA